MKSTTNNNDNISLDYNTIITNLVDRNLEKLANTLYGNFKRSFIKIRVDLRLSFINYLENSYNKYSKLKTLIYRNEPRYLYDFYEPSNLRSTNKVIDSNNSDNILNVSNFIIISGKGGLGKSILLKHIFLDQIKKENKIPVFIELREFNLHDGDLLTFINNRMNFLGFKQSKIGLDYALKSGLLVILLDGYDEVHSSKRNYLISEINNLCDSFQNNHFIISSRPDEIFLSFERFHELEILPLSKESAIDLVLKLDFDTDIKNKFAKELEDSLFENHESFASNPLLLNIMLLTYQDYARIPEKIHLFYSNAFDTLYFKHDATKGGFKREFKSNLSYDQIKYIFSEFSFKLYVLGHIEFSVNQIYEICKPMVEKYNLNLDSFIYDLEHSVCLIYLDGFNYRYTHRSFQEYFTAYFIKEQNDLLQTSIVSNLLNINKYNPRSILAMLYEMGSERFEKNVLLPILDKYNIKNNFTISDFINTFNMSIMYLSATEYMTNQQEYIDDLNEESYFLTYNCNSTLSLLMDLSYKYYHLVKPDQNTFKFDDLDFPTIHDYFGINNAHNEEGERLFEKLSDVDLCEELVYKPELVLEIINNSWIGYRFRIINKLNDYLVEKHLLKENTIDKLFSE